MVEKPTTIYVPSLRPPYSLINLKLHSLRSDIMQFRYFGHSRAPEVKPSLNHRSESNLIYVAPTMAEATPWPEYIYKSFNSAIISDPSGRDGSVFYGPFTRLLYTLFSVDGPYEIVPQFKSVVLQGTQESMDIVAVFLVEVDRHPVFFMEVKPPASFPYDSKREEADEQMRRRFRDLRQLLAIPILYGASAFGTRLSFYEYNSATHVLQPEQVLQSHPSILADVAPIARWDCDILQQEGANRLRNVVNQVKEMCAQV